MGTKPVPIMEARPSIGVHHDIPPIRGRAPGRGWVMVEGAPHHPHPPPWAIPGPSVRHTIPHEPTVLKPSAGVPHHQRFRPYEVPQRPAVQFTIQDIDKCLYGKQDLRVVQIGDNKQSPPARQNSKSTSSNPEDKNKPKWCDMCQEIRFGECPQHGPLPSLRPTVTLPGPKSYAVSTFPDEVGLCISSLPLAGYGVFARQFIPMGTWIGPYEGKKISVEEGMKQISQGDAPFLWEIYENFRLSHFLDASDENSSSWMRFIQCARHHSEQNLYVFQYYGSIYYRAFKDIQVGQELLLWYDDKYPQYFGLPYDIRDMSSTAIESKQGIQAPMEVSKSSEFESRGAPHPEDRRSRGPFIHQANKVIPTSVSRERHEPPRISSTNHILSQHASSQPPTLSQAPSLIETRSSQDHEGRIAHPTIPSSRVSQHPPSTVQHGRSPRPVNPAFRKDGSRSPNAMLRSMSAEDLRKRHLSERSPHERELVERYNNEVMNLPHPPPPPPPGLLAAHISGSSFSRLLPSVMSVAPMSLEHAKKLESAKQNELKLLQCERERHHAIERERMMHERDKIERERAIAMERVRGLPPHERHPLDVHEWEIYRCNGCGQRFNQKIALEKHHCIDAPKPYQCGKCQFSCPEARDLQEHMAMHAAERPYKCGVCSRSFSGTSSLSNHMRTHSNNNGIPLEKISNGKEPPKAGLDCQKCGKRFLHPSDLSKHTSTGECLS